MEFELKARIINAVSKNGNPYECVELFITDDFCVKVLLKSSELKLLKLHLNEII